MLRRIFPAFLCMMLAPAHAATCGKEAEASGRAQWEIWRASWESTYAATRFAVLKVNDAVFLKFGETAFLRATQDDPSSYRWSLEPGGQAVLYVVFDQRDGGGFSSRLVRDGESREGFALSFEPRHSPVNAVIDIQGSLTGEGTDDPRLQIKIFNQEHPAAKDFKGLEFFDYAPEFRIAAAYEAAAEPEAVILDTERGLKKRFTRVGAARFSLEGKTVRLPLYSLAPDSANARELFTLFTDETTGKETYGVGRYLDVAPPERDGAARVVIDFNRAYNPLCARSKHYNCPLVDFHIPVAIMAGEKAPR